MRVDLKDSACIGLSPWHLPPPVSTIQSSSYKAAEKTINNSHFAVKCKRWYQYRKYKLITFYSVYATKGNITGLYVVIKMQSNFNHTGYDHEALASCKSCFHGKQKNAILIEDIESRKRWRIVQQRIKKCKVNCSRGFVVLDLYYCWQTFYFTQLAQNLIYQFTFKHLWQGVGIKQENNFLMYLKRSVY